MSVYLVGAIDVHDEASYARYRELNIPLMQAIGGLEVLSADDNPEMFEGRQPGQHLFIVKFENMEVLRAYQNSEAYAAVKQHRIRGSDAHFIMGMRGRDEP